MRRRLRERGKMNNKNNETQKLTEENLQQLLDAISGKVGFLIGPGITTYDVTVKSISPSDDPNQRLLHESCLELERRGLIVRHNEGDGWVVWMPAEEKGLITDTSPDTQTARRTLRRL